MSKILKILKYLVFFIVSLIISTILFFGILVLSQKFLDKPNFFSSNLFELKDIIIYVVYILQLVVSSLLSYVIYKLTKNTEEREIRQQKSEKINALKYVRNEINYNRSIIKVLNKKNIEINRVNRHVLKISAWDKYSIVLIEILKSDEYNKIIGYYSTINLYSIKGLEKDVINLINNHSEELCSLLSDKEKDIEKGK